MPKNMGIEVLRHAFRLMNDIPERATYQEPKEPETHNIPFKLELSEDFFNNPRWPEFAAREYAKSLGFTEKVVGDIAWRNPRKPEYAIRLRKSTREPRTIKVYNSKTHRYELISIIKSMPSTHEERTREKGEQRELASKKEITGTGCVPCSGDHLSTVVASLNEAMRFARESGIQHPEVQRRIELAKDELNIMERIDAAPDALLKLPPKEKIIMDEMLPKARKIRQRLGEISSVAELEQIAAEAHNVRMDFKMKRSGISSQMLEKIKSLANDVQEGRKTKDQAVSELKESVSLSVMQEPTSTVAEPIGIKAIPETSSIPTFLNKADLDIIDTGDLFVTYSIKGNDNYVAKAALPTLPTGRAKEFFPESKRRAELELAKLKLLGNLAPETTITTLPMKYHASIGAGGDIYYLIQEKLKPLSKDDSKKWLRQNFPNLESVNEIEVGIDKFGNHKIFDLSEIRIDVVKDIIKQYQSVPSEAEMQEPGKFDDFLKKVDDSLKKVESQTQDKELVDLLNKATKNDLSSIAKELEYDKIIESSFSLADYTYSKTEMFTRYLRWLAKNPQHAERIKNKIRAIYQKEVEGKREASLHAQFIKKTFPEWEQVLERSGGYKPHKFLERVSIIVTPAPFNPSGQGDCAYTHAFDWNGISLTAGPSYSYDSMLTVGVNPYKRMVNVPKGHRMWVTTYDGMWGGYWYQVLIYINPEDLPSLPDPLKQLVFTGCPVLKPGE